MNLLIAIVQIAMKLASPWKHTVDGRGVWRDVTEKASKVARKIEEDTNCCSFCYFALQTHQKTPKEELK